MKLFSLLIFPALAMAQLGPPTGGSSSSGGGGNVTYCTGSASATAATCAGTAGGFTAPITYTGLTGFFTAGATSTGAPLTLNIASLGAKNVYLNGAATSAANAVLNGYIYPFVYDGTQIQLTQPATAPIYDTATSGQTGNLGAVTMVTPGANHDYLFTWTVELSVAGTNCTGNTSVVLNVIFQSINGSGVTTQALGTITLANSGVGTVGFIAEGSDNILAKSGTAVQFSTTSYTLGAACTGTNPTYIVYPTMVQLW